MCLVIKKGPLKAKKDFYTIKMMDNIGIEDCQTPYMDFVYKYGKLYTSKFEIKYYTEIEKGLHSLLVNKAAKSDWVGVTAFDGLVLCCIPKGSTYYIGNDCDIVSNQLIVVEPIADRTQYAVWSNNENSMQVNIANWGVELTELAAKYIKSLNINIKPS